MSRLISIYMVLVVAFLCRTGMAAINPVADSGVDRLRTTPGEPFLLSPPKQTGPVMVTASFRLNDVNEIDGTREKFEFTGVLTLEWNDPRQAFDPLFAGVDEKIYQGDYQFDEISPGWYPQVVLVNESGLYQKSGVVLRIRTDGSATLIETLNATAKTDFDMSQYPFDKHRLEAVFEVLGYDKDEVQLRLPSGADRAPTIEISVPQWRITGVDLSIRDRQASNTGGRTISSALVLRVDVQRASFYARRLITLPLALIVLLSFSVFWMDRASLGDRLNVSFIGILTAVAYQIVTAEQLPHISYFTVMHGFLMFSFFTMCATVVINLWVSVLDRGGMSALGNRIDRRCRWIFPLVYFGFIWTMLGIEFLLT